ncbi:TonB-dependent receptor [Novosphingobium sediminicola]|uniref:Iron complex outermembrane receptor protein n=1 Tax=Novosphingobium sediminicola TaxID=563162 RepID=A0A7W6CLC1_9SPHN|nr:TonB-dependent receptor [Novosphingobium sediminicola]MBB3957585.1 iron complex outermembrane receptor protein [Novosphingobium sediminicola]
MSKIHHLLASAALLGMVAASPAMAEDAAPAQQATAPGEIVVTAQRRAERLQDVPLAVSAISAQQMTAGGFQKLSDLQYQVSGLQFGSSPNDAGYRLRGVGTAGGFASASEQNVGTVVDNVIIPFGNPVNSLGDLERVEVLKGPQGTQFGKNASSGVVNITTAKPKFDRVSGKVFASYGSLNEINTNAQLNLPTSENSAIGLFGFYRQNDGFLYNATLKKYWGDEASYGGRAKFFYQPSDDFSVYIIGDYSRTSTKSPGQLWTINALPSFANPLMAARFGNLTSLGITPGFNNTQSAENTDGYTSERNYGASIEINKKLGSLNLTSITAYRGFMQGASQYGIDGSSTTVFQARETNKHQSFLSQELRLTNASGSKAEFTTGIYASRRKTGNPGDYSSAQLMPANPFSPFYVSISGGQSNTQTRSDSVAAFIDGKYHATEKFAVLGGFRYQYDWVNASYQSIIDPTYAPGSMVDGIFVVPYTPSPLKTGSVAKAGWAGKAGAEYKVDRDLMFFGTISRGYLGATVAFSGLTGTRTNVNPQTVRDITVGMKSQLFNRAVTFNASAFFDKYTNLQTSVFNGTEFLTENAGGFEAKGFEFDARWRVSPEFSLNGGMTYSDTKFTDYVTACPAVLKAGLSCYTSNGTSLLQAAGEPLSGAPKVSFTFGADIKLPINDRLAFDWSGNVYYRSKVQYDVGNALSYQPGYYTIGLNTGIGAPDGGWRVGLFVRNLLDQRFHASVIGLPFADAGGEVNWLTREGRRTIGVSATAKF